MSSLIRRYGVHHHVLLRRSTSSSSSARRRAAAKAAAASAPTAAAPAPSFQDFVGGNYPGGSPTSASASRGDESPMPSSPMPFGEASLAHQSAAGLAGKYFHIETYGCQMNVSDSEVIRAVLLEAGMLPVPAAGLTPTGKLATKAPKAAPKLTHADGQRGSVKDASDPAQRADVVLVNTCAIRDKAESKVWQRLMVLRKRNQSRPREERVAVGVLGCMAERLKTDLLETDQLVDIVAGPDAYRDLPSLNQAVHGGAGAGINVQLSMDET